MEKLNSILSKFQIPELAYEIETISNGFINDTYLVANNGKPIYILQRINTEVFTNINALIHNLELILPLLKGENYSEIKLTRTHNDLTFLKTANNEIWRLMTFIKDSLVFNTTTNKKTAYEAGKIIGQFHKLLIEVDVDQLEDTLPGFHDINLRYDQFIKATKNATPARIENAKRAIDFVNKNIYLLTDIELDKLPTRVCHNDTKLNNILFSKNCAALCLIDLDTLMRGKFIFDFGDAVRTIANTAAEDEKDLSIINFETKLFESFINGLAVNSDFLSEKEKELLPVGVILMPFLHGIRALTDYLGNDKYYKVNYKTQNLDRSLSLFTFAQLAIDKNDVMKLIISDKLN